MAAKLTTCLEPVQVTNLNLMATGVHKTQRHVLLPDGISTAPTSWSRMRGSLRRPRRPNTHWANSMD
ncbi:hypothetical protein HYDPIDRAFT_119549 [Hydnomerulius pinastri MD-312]|uniref:Uncharacterized protein n=1 Tax=Hydnomerulius pinastri MD-312 TaxID=994086 RepID=A0A0C9W6L0_9AGAM|nr:hypothetical protein HYDPIDRAFT_120164 [Hydnomerulius pinastri MD-312]KIJ58401.1 hypothetical protein HYDPIDRAFT_119549 [Hydnomerulius pinastri MD-312]